MACFRSRAFLQEDSDTTCWDAQLVNNAHDFVAFGCDDDCAPQQIHEYALVSYSYREIANKPCLSHLHQRTHPFPTLQRTRAMFLSGNQLIDSTMLRYVNCVLMYQRSKFFETVALVSLLDVVEVENCIQGQPPNPYLSV